MRELTEDILKKVIKKRNNQTHKGDYGRVLIIGGNAQYGGAAILATSSAVYAGSGLVTVACDKKNHTPMHSRLPEAMVLDYKEDIMDALQTSDVIIIGCGLGLEEQSLKLLNLTLQNQKQNQWLVIDGSAITLFAKEKMKLKYPEKVIFTPHQMELQRLSGIKIADQNVENVQEFVHHEGFTVVAKSHETKIFSPSREIRFLKIGTPAQAVGGMGDTLAGMIGSFIGQFRENIFESIEAATFLHSYIAHELSKESYVVLPSHLIAEIPKMMKKFES